MNQFKLAIALWLSLPLLCHANATNKPADCSLAQSQVNQRSSHLCEGLNQELASLMPRLGQIAEVASSEDAQYVVFKHNGKELWLYSRNQGAVRLLELGLAQGHNIEFSPQWSADGRWLLYISHKSDVQRPRIFSVDKKRHYALPVKSWEYSAITWTGDGQSIGFQDFIGDPQQLARFKTLGIQLKMEQGYEALANR